MDKIAKIVILVLLMVFMFAYYQKSQIGRFVPMGSRFVLDTHTGRVYAPKIIEGNPLKHYCFGVVIRKD